VTRILHRDGRVNGPTGGGRIKMRWQNIKLREREMNGGEVLSWMRQRNPEAVTCLITVYISSFKM
jgi:hypothetical protein